MLNKRTLGDDVELECTRFLSYNNIHDIERNYRCRYGEIDIIGRDGDYLVFFEVKYRKRDTSGSAECAVGYSKQLQICKVSDYYRYENNISEDSPIRYDVLAVNDNKIMWYKNAFEYVTRRKY